MELGNLKSIMNFIPQNITMRMIQLEHRASEDIRRSRDLHMNAAQNAAKSRYAAAESQGTAIKKMIEQSGMFSFIKGIFSIGLMLSSAISAGASMFAVGAMAGMSAIRALLWAGINAAGSALASLTVSLPLSNAIGQLATRGLEQDQYEAQQKANEAEMEKAESQDQAEELRAAEERYQKQKSFYHNAAINDAR